MTRNPEVDQHAHLEWVSAEVRETAGSADVLKLAGMSGESCGSAAEAG